MIFPETLLTGIAVIAILFVAALTRSTFGFGDALVAMPLLALLVGIKAATPLVALTALVNATFILLDSWRVLDVRAAGRLLIGAVLGIPPGLSLLIHAPEAVVKGTLGVLLIIFALYHLRKPKLPDMKGELWAYPFGFLAGLLGGAYNTNGPPVVVYGVLKKWPPAHFRATMQGFLLPSNILIIGGHGLSGLWTKTVLQMFIFSVPAVIVAIFLGRKINYSFSEERFTRWLYRILIILGALLLW